MRARPQKSGRNLVIRMTWAENALPVVVTTYICFLGWSVAKEVVAIVLR